MPKNNLHALLKKSLAAGKFFGVDSRFTPGVLYIAAQGHFRFCERDFYPVHYLRWEFYTPNGDPVDKDVIGNGLTFPDYPQLDPSRVNSRIQHYVSERILGTEPARVRAEDIRAMPISIAVGHSVDRPPCAPPGREATGVSYFTVGITKDLRIVPHSPSQPKCTDATPRGTDTHHITSQWRCRNKPFTPHPDP